MRLSKKFLSDYIDLNGIDFHDLAEKMLFVGNEYENINRLSDATGLVVGYVKECVKHPNSDKLSVCKVDIGDEKLYQIVCGANNVRENIKVIVAKVGATLPGGIKITNATLAGVESNGMICSLAELGLDSKFLVEEDYLGIHILSDDAEVGSDAIEYLGFDDEIIEFELTPDRGDLLSVLGMAYEVGSIYKKDVKYPDVQYKVNNESVKDLVSLDVQTDNCTLYSTKIVRNVVVKESPNFIKNRLLASGIRPINNVVDISNYVMLELGQPLHFFDYDKLGNKIVVRQATKGEKIVTLDGNEHTLEESDVVIADYTKPVALAGVMGGLDTEVTENTKTILIESAIFNPKSVRETSKKILRSESSNRFEKGIDPNRTLLALNRACHLLSLYAGGEVLADEVVYDITNKDNKEVRITGNKIRTILGMDVSNLEIGEVFKSLKFNYELDGDNFIVSVPTRRGDITISEDLIEEVGRIIGYDNVLGKLPEISIKPGMRTKKASLIREIRNRLFALGLNQTLTYSLVSENDKDKFLNDSSEVIKLMDPLSEDKKYMRRSLIPSLINVYKYNYSRNIKDISIFEIGSSYYVKDNEYIEESKVSGLITGNYFINNWQQSTKKSDFYVLKGIVENILEYLGLSNRYSYDSTKTLEEMHPYVSCAVLVDREIIGYIGQVHPKIESNPIYVFELSIDKLKDIRVRNIKYKEITKYPSITKDLAFVMPIDLESKVVYDIIKKSGGRLLESVEVFDVYTGDKIDKDKKSVAYTLKFQDMTKTLTDDVVNELVDDIVFKVTSKLNITLR